MSRQGSGAFSKLGTLILLLGILVGCAPQPSPDVLWPTPESPQKKETVTVAPDAMAELLEQAASYRQQQDWYGVIGVAEQGLRINRRTPQWYLLLTESYQALSQPQQALHFARLGQRYCHSSSPECSHLRRLGQLLERELADKR